MLSFPFGGDGGSEKHSNWADVLQLVGHKIVVQGTSLVVQWLRMHLVMQRSWVRSLVRELRSPCHGATKPASCNC